MPLGEMITNIVIASIVSKIISVINKTDKSKQTAKKCNPNTTSGKQFHRLQNKMFVLKWRGLSQDRTVCLK